LIHSRSRLLPGRRLKQFTKAITLISSRASIFHPQAALQPIQVMYVNLCQMTPQWAVHIVCQLLDRMTWHRLPTCLGPGKVEYDGVTYKICMPEITTYCLYIGISL
jgi:hypothetical protein